MSKEKMYSNGVQTAEIDRGPQRKYDETFIATPEYKDTLPDLQNGSASLIQGKPVAIQQVGIHNFRIPLQYKQLNGSPLSLETSVTGCVSLEAHKKGINMSRIMRTFYEHKDSVFSINQLANVLRDYRENLQSLECQLMLRFRYPSLNQ